MRRIAFVTFAALTLAACSNDTTAPDSLDFTIDAASTGTALTLAGGYDGDLYQDRLANGLPDSLKLSADQQARIKALVSAFQTATKADRDVLEAILSQARDAGKGSQRSESVRAILAKGAAIIGRLQAAETKLKADIDAVLTADQRAWLADHQPKKCRPDRFPSLTDAQKAQIKALEKGFQDNNKADLDAVKAAFDQAKGKSREEAAAILEKVAPAAKRLEAARKQLHDAIAAVLTPEQKSSGCLPLG